MLFFHMLVPQSVHMLWTLSLGREAHERLPSQTSVRASFVVVFLLTKPVVYRRVALTKIVPRHHHRPFSPDSVAQRNGKRHEFDRAPLAPVPWRQPVLRAVFACPRIPRSMVAAGFRLWPISVSKGWATLAPSNELARPTLYPAPPSAQIPDGCAVTENLVSKRTFQPNNRRRPRPTASACVCAPVRAAPSWLLAGVRVAPNCPPEARRVLPARHRLRSSSDFAAVFRGARGAGGSRSGSRFIVVHVTSTDARAGQPPRVGLVVSKTVGNAVVRNRTKRVLRAPHEYSDRSAARGR